MINVIKDAVNNIIDHGLSDDLTQIMIRLSEAARLDRISMYSMLESILKILRDRLMQDSPFRSDISGIVEDK